MNMQPTLLILTLFAVVLATACGDSTAPPAPAPPQVAVATPLIEAITDWDGFTGRLAAVESVDIRARVSGYLESVNFKAGSFVEKGDLLFVIDPRPDTAVLNEAKAELTRAGVQLELATNDLERAQGLSVSNAISEEILDERTQQKREAAATLEAAKAKVVSAALNVEFTHVKAPISGRISRAFVTEGNLVSGGNEGATRLTTIVSLDPIHLYFTADERAYLRYLRLDQAGARPSSHDAQNPVRLRLTDEVDFVHVGYMDFVDNRIDEETGTVQGRAIFPNPEYLLVPGMFAEIQLRGEGPYQALLIPDEAIGADQAQQFVFVLDRENVAHRRLIRTGGLEGTMRIIREGLSRDDRVVINGIQRVRAGSPVTPESVDLKDRAGARR